ncbi:MAG: hypothetical protein K9M49_00590 [Candidatus Marinimicrobia bacterium]|nr:hypothetical protein [Candidatus Neomarinimicrobiota bacterium]MCF7850641.1 hypothetical protein [Candidatus Neomarinimicrobiota bacterium]MCF7903625.1 hypothetical protein [Candidatus Neomarinimicrobiota bacterium]
MFNHIRKAAFYLGLFQSVLLFAQQIPVKEPQLLPFPSFKGGATFFSHIPTDNLVLAATSGWTSADILEGFAGTADLELLRFRWGKYILGSSKMDIHSSIWTSIFYQFDSNELHSSYPNAFQVSNTPLSGFEMKALISETYLQHSFIFKYSRRGQFHASLGTGLTHLSLYRNDSGARLIDASGLGIHLGTGWKYTLFGRDGDRVRIGFNLGYSIRNFDIGEQDERITLSDGSAGQLTPIQSISFNTPDIQISIEMGERFFSAYTPYRDPFRLGLLNLSAGLGMINLQDGVSIQYDTAGVSLEVPSMGAVTQNYDVQIFKYNWPFHFIKQSNIDAFSGAGIRYWKTSQHTNLPSGWARNFTDGSKTLTGMAFAPKILDVYLDHEITYPLGKRLYASIGAGTGYANLTLYENINKSSLIKAGAFTWQVSSGVGFTVQGDGSSLIAIGLSAGYYKQAFEIDLAESEFEPETPSFIAPINYVDFSHPVISFDIGLIFGGKTNAAQEAHAAFRDKKFTSAVEIQDDFLSAFPNHHNKDIMRLERQMIEDTLITHYYRDAHDVLSQGKLQNAYSLLRRGKTPPTERINNAVEGMKRTIADQALQTAADELKRLNYLRAEEMIQLALKSDPSSVEVAKALLARSYIIRATILYQSKTYSRSLYWLKLADGLTDRYKMVTAQMREKIGEGRLEDANEGILKEDREMVYQSMQEAKSLNPGLGDVVEQHMKDLEHAMDRIQEDKVRSLKRMAVENMLDEVSNLDPENFTPRVGMQGSVLATYVGDPSRKFQEGKYELWTYSRKDGTELWLYLRNGLIEKVAVK